MKNRTSGWVIVGSIASVVAAVWIVLSPPGLWELYESGRLSGLVAALAWLLPLFALAGAAWKWRDRWKRWLRARYVSAVWRAAVPVRDEVSARFIERDRAASGQGAGEPRSALEEAAARLAGLSVNALRVLQFALAACNGSDAGRVSADQVFSGGVGWPIGVDPFGLMGQRLDQACNQLVRAGFLASYEMTISREAADVAVRREVAEADKGGELSRLVREQLRRRSRGVAKGAVGAAEEQVPSPSCEAKIRELSKRSVGVLEYLLRLFIDHPGEVVSEDLLDPEILMSPLKSLEGGELNVALKELVDAGFLQEPHWEGTELRVRVTQCLANRAVAKRVFEYLQSLMASEC